MTNIGFSQFAKENDINIITASVGDRYVLEKMLEGGYNIGGEQSGHIIFLDEATTGDGQLSGVKVLEVLQNSGVKMSELAGIMTSYPQVMVNVKVTPEVKANWKSYDDVKAVIEKYEKILGDDGRILVRESGTEPLVRVMLEGKDTEQITAMANEIADKIREHI